MGKGASMCHSGLRRVSTCHARGHRATKLGQIHPSPSDYHRLSENFQMSLRVTRRMADASWTKLSQRSSLRKDQDRCSRWGDPGHRGNNGIMPSWGGSAYLAKDTSWICLQALGTSPTPTIIPSKAQTPWAQGNSAQMLSPGNTCSAVPQVLQKC